MKRLVVAALAASVLIACKSERPQPTPAPSDSNAAANLYTIDEKDVPVAPDFEEEALKAITPENVEAEVAKMEKELD